jgi:hypothetical protein
MRQKWKRVGFYEADGRHTRLGFGLQQDGRRDDPDLRGRYTILRLDITGDGKVDYQMKINGDVTGESGDWLL